MESNLTAAGTSLLQSAPDPDGSAATLSLTVLVCVFAIPVVAFALWGDYFERRVRHDRLRGELDFAAESFLLNSAGLVVFILQIVNYFSLRPYQAEQEGMTVLLFIGGLFVQAALHLDLGRKLELEAEAENAEVMGQAARPAESATEVFPDEKANPETELVRKASSPDKGWSASLWLASLLAGYISFAGACGVAAILIANRFQAGPLASAITGVFGTGIGIISGLSVVYALAPVTVRRLFEVSPLQSEETLSLVRESFSRANLPCPEVFVVHHAELQTHNVMIAGFTQGRGVFKPAVYITEGLIADRLPGLRAPTSRPSAKDRERTFNEAELRAILLHEVAHASLQHLRRRFALTSAIVVAGLIAGTLGWVVARTLLPAGLAELVQLGIAAAVVFVPFSKIHRLIYQQELEADLHAVIVLGALPEAMISALEKLDAANGRDSAVALGSHPSTLKRISELRQLLPSGVVSPQTNENRREDDDRRAA